MLLIPGTEVPRLRGTLETAPVGFPLLPERFTLHDLQEVDVAWGPPPHRHRRLSLLAP